jgi:hypothetical protein
LFGVAQSRFQAFVGRTKILEFIFEGSVFGIVFIDTIFEQSNLACHVFDIEFVVGSLMAPAPDQRKNRHASPYMSASDREPSGSQAKQSHRKAMEVILLQAYAGLGVSGKRGIASR